MPKNARNNIETIYLDHAGTTAMDPRVLQAMLPYFTEHFGNPSSVHMVGQEARSALDGARAVSYTHLTLPTILLV